MVIVGKRFSTEGVLHHYWQIAASNDFLAGRATRIEERFRLYRARKARRCDNESEETIAACMNCL